jgi:LmbE family N-acetylglucosaminyl deacetylase
VQIIEEAGSADVVLAFDEAGITGHHDHIAATEAAKAFALSHETTLYLWTLPEEVATTLNERFATSFRGRPEDQITTTLNVVPERGRQWQSICCHQSQAGGLSIVRARLELMRGQECLIERYRGSQGITLFAKK